eukprot:CAMPEP_0183392288 /NCGR_PEP_ID=MMETSP0370-20130417/7039_1 /TAXON_ID=268820 /ORGANISM="Peridinium aciculiferum, Strain PAER-2" /LENGTH=343 /DNA_ID=CAMNT_0025572193 /DNA_START=49 /DNA_END=1080 /DNA_ORIENTATION=+
MTGPGVQKKVGPNDKCPCDSGQKAKKCCQAGAAAAPTHTPMQGPKGQVLPGNAEELWSMAKDADRAGEFTKAAHFYTMAIDVVVKGMPRDQHGKASDADLVKYNKSSDGTLAKLLSDRSNVYLRQGNMEDAVEDAQTCTRADPANEKGHLRVAVALEAAGAALQLQLEACEAGLAACPESEVLVNRKWRLKKAIAEQPESVRARGQKDASEPSIEETRRVADDASDPMRGMAAADLGCAFAVGAHGLPKDLQEAERYLRLGSKGGDVGAQRNLGIILLDLGRPVEAAEELSKAAAAGDEQAAEVLEQLSGEIAEKQAQARTKLEAMAASGDPRAKAMLEELFA